MSTQLEKFNKAQEKGMPDIRPGDIIKVHQKIKEGDKERPSLIRMIVYPRL